MKVLCVDVQYADLRPGPDDYRYTFQVMDERMTRFTIYGEPGDYQKGITYNLIID